MFAGFDPESEQTFFERRRWQSLVGALLIKEAVEALFGVKVKAVNTTITKGKVKRFRGQLGKRRDVKKAYLTLEEGNTIDVTTGL